MVMSHLSSPLTAPDTLAAMYEDNMSQMQSVSPDIVAASVQLIRVHGHMPRFINFLRQICGTRERPMPTNQVGSAGRWAGGLGLVAFTNMDVTWFDVLPMLLCAWVSGRML